MGETWLNTTACIIEGLRKDKKPWIKGAKETEAPCPWIRSTTGVWVALAISHAEARSDFAPNPS